MNFYDDQQMTTRELFEKFFPGREDVIRLLMEPITYANGSTLEDPAISYGIVFSNFMSKGVFTFSGRHRSADQADARRPGAQRRRRAHSLRRGEDTSRKGGRVTGVRVNGRDIATRAVVSNANLKSTIFRLVGEEQFDRGFVDEARAVRLNNSSCQVYMALQAGRRAGRKPGRFAVQLHGAAVSHRGAVEPRRHQPHLFVLLPAHPAGQQSLADRVEHQRPL